MPNADIMPSAQQWAHTLLIWVGFGTLTGLLAKVLMPGRDPGGPIATFMIGVGGSVIGCGILSYFHEGEHISPLSPLGFVVATGGAFVILFFYKLLSGRVIYESGEGTRRPWYRPSYRRRRRVGETLFEE